MICHGDLAKVKKLTYEMARAETVRALRAAYPDRWEEIFETISRPPRVVVPGAYCFISTVTPRVGEPVELLSASACRGLISNNVFPFHFRLCEIASSSFQPAILRLSHVHELGRWPLEMFYPGASFHAVLSKHAAYSLTVEALMPWVGGDPLTVVFCGTLMDERAYSMSGHSPSNPLRSVP